MAKILICVPAMDMVATGFCQSLAMLQKSGHEVSIMFQVGSLIYDSRNRLAKQALKMSADYTMWFDSDMIFEPDTMRKLLADDKDIVSGMYFRRSHPYSLVAFDELDIENKKFKDAEVLFNVAAKFGCWFDPINGFGEDLSFCWRARECGYEVYLDPKVSCGHVGHVVVTEAMSRAIQEEIKNEG